MRHRACWVLASVWAVAYNLSLFGVGVAVGNDVDEDWHPLVTVMAWVAAVLVVAVLGALRDSYRDACKEGER